MALEVAEQLEFTKSPFCHKDTVYLVDPLDGHLVPELIVHRSTTKTKC